MTDNTKMNEDAAIKDLRLEALMADDCFQVMDGVDPRTILALFALAQPAESVGREEPPDAEFEQEAHRLFDCVHNNMGWKPIEESLRKAFSGGNKP